MINKTIVWFDTNSYLKNEIEQNECGFRNETQSANSIATKCQLEMKLIFFVVLSFIFSNLNVDSTTVDVARKLDKVSYGPEISIDIFFFIFLLFSTSFFLI